MRVGDVLNTFATAAHAPSMTLRVNAALLGFIPRGVKKSLMALTPIRRPISAFTESPFHVLPKSPCARATGGCPCCRTRWNPSFS